MQIRQFIVALLGVVVHYYDHHLFGFLAVKISQYYLPSGSGIVQLINAYFIMAVAVAARPIGAIALGRIGDVYGREFTVNVSLCFTAIASFCLAITPSYAEIGIGSLILLLISRMIICAFAASGSDGVRIFIYEHIGKSKQCLGNGLVTGATLLGSLAASLSAWLLTMDYMPESAWRVAFLVGGALGIIMIAIRKLLFVPIVDDSVTKHSDYEIYKNTPLLKIVKEHWILFLLCSIIAGSIGSTNQFYIIFFGTYNMEILHNINNSQMQIYTSVAIIIYIICSIFAGLLADYIGRSNLLYIAFAVLVTLTIKMIFTISNNEPITKLYFLTIATLPFMVMPALALLKQSIPLVIRYRIFSLAHACGSIVISAPTAFVSVLLYHKTQLNWVPILYFLIVIFMIAFCVNILCKQYRANEY